jgi:hypothetical protein
MDDDEPFAISSVGIAADDRIESEMQASRKTHDRRLPAVTHKRAFATRKEG